MEIYSKENNKLRDITTDIILVNILQPVRFSNAVH